MGINVNISWNDKHTIWSKAALGLPLTPRERAFYLLYATEKEVKEFLKKEKKDAKSRT